MKVLAKGTIGEPRGRKPYWDEDMAECLSALRSNNQIVCDHLTIPSTGKNVINNKALWRMRIASMCRQMGKPMVHVYWVESDDNERRITPVLSRR